MSILRARGITYRHSTGPVVLRDVSLRLDRRDRVALVGQNGAGKTTLLRLLNADLEPTEGRVDRDLGLRVSYFSQHSDIPDDVTLDDLLEAEAATELAIDAELATIEGTLGTPDADVTALLDRQQELLVRMDEVGGWDVRRRIDTIASRLGFDHDHRRRRADALSMGWRNRAALARLLMQSPDVVLLDEPTNYLDLEGLAWLESWMRAFPGAAVIASHDRHFLDQVATRIVEVASAALDEYPGGFEAYVQKRHLQQGAIEKRSRYEAELMAFEAAAIKERRDAARSPSKAVRRRLADIKKDTTPPLVDQVLTDLYARLQVGERLGVAENLAASRGGRPLFRDLNLEITRGDRIGIVGPNGSGKTTLLGVLQGDLPPDVGRMSRPGGTAWTSFDEVRAGLDPRETLSHAVNTAPMVVTAPRKQVHRFLEMLRFSELDLKKPVGDLSGGQQARAALAVCLLSGAGVLVADEPTNHLDLMSTQVLERALVHFPGAVVVVSHDRFFLDKVANRLLVLGGDEVEQIEGTWTTWQAARSVPEGD